jgi:hypothetical protein
MSLSLVICIGSEQTQASHRICPLNYSALRVFVHVCVCVSFSDGQMLASEASSSIFCTRFRAYLESRKHYGMCVRPSAVTDTKFHEDD